LAAPGSSALAAVELTHTALRIGPHASPLAARVLAGLDLLSRVDRPTARRLAVEWPTAPRAARDDVR